MLSRKEQLRPAKHLPDEWGEKVKASLLELYGEMAKKEGKTFQVHGLTYPDEIFLAVSYADFEDASCSPLTYAASADLNQTDSGKNLKKLFEVLVDSSGLFFEAAFYGASKDLYDSAWRKSELRRQSFYYQVTRENVALTLQANQLLGE